MRVSREQLERLIESFGESKYDDGYDDAKAEKAMRKECNLKTINGRVILRMDAESKNRHTLTDGVGVVHRR